MIRKVICFIGVLVLGLCATMLAEKNYEGFDVNAGAEEISASNEEFLLVSDFAEEGYMPVEEWTASWESALAQSGYSESSLNLSSSAEVPEDGFSDIWDVGWDDLGSNAASI